MGLRIFIESDISELLKWLENTDSNFLMQFAGPKLVYPLDSKQLLDLLNDKKYLLFSYESNGDIVGHCELMEINNETHFAKIGRVLVDPQKRNMGYGSDMIQELLSYSKSKMGLNIVELNVFDYNKPAYNCYRKHGFYDIKTTTNHYEKFNIDLTFITMQKEL